MRQAGIMWAVAAGLGGGGLSVFAAEFDTFGSPWRFVGLGLMLAGCMTGNAALVLTRQRTLDEEFEAGYRAGHRAGRRASGRSTVVNIDRRRRRSSGRISTPPLGPMASHRAPAGRAQAHQD